MKKLTQNQRLVLSEFFGNFAVAWLATGLVAPIITNNYSYISVVGMITSLILSSGMLIIMLQLTRDRRGGKKKK